MKNSIKLGLGALALSVTLASCFGDDDKPKTPDSSATTVKIDTASVSKIDSAGTDTTVKKSTTSKEKTETKKM